MPVPEYLPSCCKSQQQRLWDRCRQMHLHQWLGPEPRMRLLWGRAALHSPAGWGGLTCLPLGSHTSLMTRAKWLGSVHFLNSKSEISCEPTRAGDAFRAVQGRVHDLEHDVRGFRLGRAPFTMTVLKDCVAWKELNPGHPTCPQKHIQDLFQRKPISWLQERERQRIHCCIHCQRDRPETQALRAERGDSSLDHAGIPHRPRQLPFPSAFTAEEGKAPTHKAHPWFHRKKQASAQTLVNPSGPEGGQEHNRLLNVLDLLLPLRWK